MDTDKIGHGYLSTYEVIADDINTHNGSPHILELGVAGGGSLRLWKEMFSTAHVIVGVDINAQAVWPEGAIKVVADQSDPFLEVAIGRALPPGVAAKFDLIVDDASHDSGRTRAALDSLWPLLVQGGYYVIEDWSHCNLMMGDLAAELPALAFTEGDHTWDIASITYRPGLIILRKKYQD